MRVKYIVGIARNSRLLEESEELMERACVLYESTGKKQRLFDRFDYAAGSWSWIRSVIVKAEHGSKGANPRFIVTNIVGNPKHLYDQHYCIRGEMENRIKEQQLDLYADRTSTGTLRANQLRLWFATLAYLLVNKLREVGLAGTELAKATCGTIRLRLFKIGALVRVTVRRVWISLSSAFPMAHLLSWSPAANES